MGRRYTGKIAVGAKYQELGELRVRCEQIQPKKRLTNEECDGLQERCEKLQAELTKHRWIPVSERLPKNISDVWIVLKAKATDSYVVGVGYYGEDETGYHWEIYGDGLLTEVSHWKPIVLPEQEQ